MSAYKDDKTGTWYAYFRYSDWTGDRKQKMKRGFPTKREALEWERAFLQKTAADLSMSFESFTEVYFNDMRNRIREYTWQTKENIIRTKLIPFFGKKKMSEIQTRDVIAWQNEMLAHRDAKGKGYSDTYLKTMHNQLSAVLNHAVRHYELKSNAASKVGPIGKKEAKEMLFWTKAEYVKFADAMMDKPLSYYAFEILYWCGLRLGELLALTPADFDFEKETVSVTKSYQRLRGRDVVTEPKTQKSNRVISMPTFLCEEIQEYLNMIYRVQPTDRIFTVTKSYLHHEMDRGSKASGVKRIRVHDIRHSHVSLLIEMGFSALAIADRVGHESIDITYRYAHLFPTKQTEIANKLNIQRREDT
jgi:integrase